MESMKKGIVVSTLLAAVGGLIGSNSHARAGEGALIGGAVGALGGALVGHGMDKADEKKREEANSSQRYRERGAEPSTYNTYNSASASGNRITNLTVMDWTRQGVKEEIIIDRIQRSGQTFVVTASDERDLRNAGVRQTVIDAMKNAR